MQGKGKCLCGEVKITAHQVSKKLGACHCGMCRKWSGGPLFAVDCGTEVSFEGQEFIETYQSSAWAQRGFCKKCGTHLFYQLKEKSQYIVAAGLFDDVASFDFDHQVFIDEKPEYYSFANQTKDMTGAELFAKLV